jgi:hypothetical protein
MSHSDTRTTKRTPRSRLVRKRWDKVDTRTASLGATGNVTLDLGGHAYRVVLNCKSETDATEHLRTDDISHDTHNITPGPQKEVTS